MFQTIKGKISIVYTGLIVMVVILGIASLYNLYKISKSIDGLITTNYNSIKRLTAMDDAISHQNFLIVYYIHATGADCSEEFNADKEIFLTNYFNEYETIIFPEEMEYIKNIKSYYDAYVDMFAYMIALDTDVPEGFAEASLYYEKTIIPQTAKVKAEISKLFNSNETMLFARKADTADMVTSASKALLILFAIAAVGGYSLAKTYTNNLFAPIYEITQTVKSIRQGNITRKRMNITTFDEVGELADEFNNMLTRLAEFEKSTVGSLMEEKDKSVAILRSISEPLIILDADFKVELLNERYEEMFGIRLEEAAGKPFTAALPSGDIIRKFNEIDYRAAEYKEAVVETKLQGENKIFNVVLTPMRYSTTGLPAMIVIFHDITELKTLEKMRSDFIATISHEFKTPLTSVLMGIDLMENSALGKLNTDQKEILQTIQEDSQRLTNLVNDLLELSRIESTAMIYNFVPCDINTIIKVSAKQFGPMAKKNSVAFGVVLGGKMPRVRADFLKITWVMNNLLSNAVKYTREGDSITVRSWSVGPEVYVSVADTGIGIPKEFIGRVFDKFVQVYGCDIEMRGTGVGLAAAKEIITAHGGDIWCESALNEGSTFTFTLNATEQERGAVK